jgi:hypothetical protein
MEGFLAHFGQDAGTFKGETMDNVILIRMIAGIGALIVLGIIILRRKRQSID